MYKYEYGICSCTDEEIYKKQCEVLEKNIPNLKKKKELQDVDGSLIQIYEYEGKEIIVANSYMYNGVHVKSQIELSQFLNKY